MRDLKKIFLTAGAVAAVGATASIGTFAGFTDTETIGGNNFSSGTVKVDLAGDAPGGTSVLSLSDMVIDDVVGGNLVVFNTGTAKSSYKISAIPAGHLVDTPALNEYADQMQVQIVDFNGLGTADDTYLVPWTPVSQVVANGAVTLEPSIKKGGSKMYNIAVRLVSTGFETLDNALQAKSGALSFKVDATQRNGAFRPTNTDSSDVNLDSAPDPIN